MLKMLSVIPLLLFLTICAQAQDDFPRVQISATYANLKLPSGGTTTARHTGFSTQAGFNFSPWLGVENHLGLYRLGFGTTLITDIVGVRPTGRPLSGSTVVPYGVIGYGVGHITASNSRYAQGNVPAIRLSGGLEFRIRKPLSARVEMGRLWLRSGIAQSGLNGTAGLVFNLLN